MLSLADFKLIYRNQRQLWQKHCLQKKPFAQADKLQQALLSTNPDKPAEYCQQLIDYFWPAFCHYRTAAGCRAYYPGLPSIYGATNDGIEGISRTLPMWAAYSSSPLAKPELSEKMLLSLRESLLNGTDPAHRYYWGEISNKSTLICEAADIALALWLVKDSLWLSFTEQQQQQILDWLKQVPGKITADNNWHLFVVQVDAVLAVLDSKHQFNSQHRLTQLNSFYVGDGCYQDGKQGAVDLYNAWGFHYHFFRLSQIMPQYDFQPQRLLDYCDWFQHLFTEQGVVLYGRSLCYRFAVSTPLLIRAAITDSKVDLNIAITALLRSWQYFVSNEGLRFGRPTQGVFKDDERWLDPYSGPASSFWGGRSLVMFYALSQHQNLKDINLIALPLQQHAIEMECNLAEIKIEKKPAENTVHLLLDNTDASLADIITKDALSTIKKTTQTQRFKSAIFACSHRPANNLQKMGLKHFCSDLEVYR
ncbi:DUF2264 domain-containing protein [Arsukibacterium sp.]|uniref:DUF2264 domain-containing protein n=1 Tax=Arsukibacterium sp. TaxID=1977258 RepID=UPI002FDA5AF4